MYDFSGYRAFVRVAKSMGLKLQAVMSFHACGANVGDTAQVPLPDWVLKVRGRPSRNTHQMKRCMATPERTCRAKQSSFVVMTLLCFKAILMP